MGFSNACCIVGKRTASCDCKYQGKFFHVETGYIQGSWNKVMNPEFTGGLHQHADHKESSQEAGQRWRIFQGGNQESWSDPLVGSSAICGNWCIDFLILRSPEWVVEPLLLRWCGAWLSQKMPGVNKEQDLLSEMTLKCGPDNFFAL